MRTLREWFNEINDLKVRAELVDLVNDDVTDFVQEHTENSDQKLPVMIGLIWNSRFESFMDAITSNTGPDNLTREKQMEYMKLAVEIDEMMGSDTTNCKLTELAKSLFDYD